MEAKNTISQHIVIKSLAHEFIPLLINSAQKGLPTCLWISGTVYTEKVRGPDVVTLLH